MWFYKKGVSVIKKIRGATEKNSVISDKKLSCNKYTTNHLSLNFPMLVLHHNKDENVHRFALLEREREKNTVKPNGNTKVRQKVT